MRLRFTTADSAMIAATLLWALGTVLCRNAFGSEPGSFRVVVFNTIRFALATAMLFGWLIVRGENYRIARGDVPGFAVVTFFGMFLFTVLFHAGLALGSAASTGIIMAAIPLVIALMAVLAGVEHPSGRLIAGILVGSAGVVVLHLREEGLCLDPGGLLVLLSTGCWGIYAVYGERYLRHYSALTITAWTFLLTTLFHLPLALWWLPRQTFSAITAANWGNLAYATIGALLIANALYYSAIHRIGPSRSGVYINLEPVFTVIFAALIRGEHLGGWQGAGFAVILAGVALATLRVEEEK